VHDDTWTDLTKAVMQDGEWYLVPAKHVNDFVSAGRESVIIHKCHKWTSELRSPERDDGGGGLPWEPLGYWTIAGSELHPCKLCDVRPPADIVSLWLLHNFDTFAGDPPLIARMITKAVSKAFHDFERQYFVQGTGEDTPVHGGSGLNSCPCPHCRDKYGEWT